MIPRPQDDRAEALRFFHGLLNALAFMLCVGVVVGLYLITP